MNERLDTQQERLARIENNVSAVEEKLSTHINAVKTELNETITQEAGALANLIVDHDTQIEELQEAVGLKPRQQ